MRKFFGKVFLLVIVLAASATASRAQNVETGKNEFSVWGGVSPASSTVIRGTGRTPDVRFVIASVRYARRFNNGDRINLKYTADFTPLAILAYPDTRTVQTSANVFQTTTVRRASYGYGISPLGLQINFRPHKKIQPFVEGTGGLLYFSNQIPNNLGTHFNFTANVGAGAEFRLKEGRAVTIGYKYFHISNGNRGIQNPGIDNNLIYVGYTFLSK